MTIEEKIKIKKMRLSGDSYAKISEVLKVSENTIKSFCRRNNLQKLDETEEISSVCKNCGKQLVQATKQKPKKFCSDECRLQWWKENREKIKKNAIYIVRCKYCGKKFESYGNKNRKFCGHECYINYRYYSVIESL